MFESCTMLIKPSFNKANERILKAYEDDAMLECQVQFIEAIFPSRKTSKRIQRMQFPCVQCGKVYKYKKGLWAHMKYECGKLPQFECAICHKKCNQKSNLVVHFKKFHEL